MGLYTDTNGLTLSADGGGLFDTRKEDFRASSVSANRHAKQNDRTQALLRKSDGGLSTIGGQQRANSRPPASKKMQMAAANQKAKGFRQGKGN